MCRLSLIFFFASWVSAAALTILPALQQPKFVNPLNVPPKIYPLLSGGVINITMRPVNQSLGLYTTNMTRVLTPVWGYNGMYPGPTIITPNDTDVVVIWQNSLPDTHIFHDALDPRVDCGPRFRFGVFEDINNCTLPEVRSVVHLHGARVDHLYDGYPEAWYDNTNGLKFHGASWDGFRPFSGITYRYTNGQEAATLWYHDHAVGITRLNVYAGLAGFYLIQDKWERSLGLPDGDYDIPLIIQDKDFTLSGDLYYPYTITSNLPQIQNFGLPLLPFMLVNGGIWPYLEVRPTKYRIRLLNGCDTRFLNLSLTGGNVQAWKIGADQGLLDHPVQMDLYDYSQVNLFFGPAERIELVLDFTNSQNQDINFTNGGNYIFDYLKSSNRTAFTEDLKTAGLVMQFRVRGAPLPSNPIPSRLRETDFHIELTPNNKTRYKAVTVRSNPLNTSASMLVLGHWNVSTSKSVPWGVIPFMWNDTVSDIETKNVTTDWWICKTGGGIHPIHIHWLEFEVIDRWYFNDKVDPKYGSGIGPKLPKWHYDEGPKDVIQAYPGECVQVRLLFKVPGRFIWHCHILSHEDLDMMRPLIITDSIQEAEDRLAEILAKVKSYLLTNESEIEEALMDLRLRVADLGLIDGYNGSEPLLELIFPPIELPEGSPYEKVSHYLNAHASLMALGWGIILPLGMTWARHKKVDKDQKRRHAFLHAAIQTIGVVFVLIAFIIGFVKLKTDRDDHLVHVHRAMGITIFTLVWFNPLSGFLRLRLDERKTPLNFIVVKVHSWLVFSAFILAFVQIPIGMSIAGASYDYTVIYVSLMAIIIAFVLVAELYFSWKEQQKPTDTGVSMDDVKKPESDS